VGTIDRIRLIAADHAATPDDLLTLHERIPSSEQPWQRSRTDQCARTCAPAYLLHIRRLGARGRSRARPPRSYLISRKPRIVATSVLIGGVVNVLDGDPPPICGVGGAAAPAVGNPVDRCPGPPLVYDVKSRDPWLSRRTMQQPVRILAERACGSPVPCHCHRARAPIGDLRGFGCRKSLLECSEAQQLLAECGCDGAAQRVGRSLVGRDHLNHHRVNRDGICKRTSVCSLTLLKVGSSDNP